MHKNTAYLTSVDQNPRSTGADEECVGSLQLYGTWVSSHYPDHSVGFIFHIRKVRKSCFLSREILLLDTLVAMTNLPRVQSHLRNVEHLDHNFRLSY